MSSRKPRVALTVPPDLMSVLERYAKVEGRPVATVIVHLLEELRPQLEQIMGTIEAVNASNAAQLEKGLKSMLADTMSMVLDLQAELDGKGLDGLKERMVAKRRADQQRARRAAARAARAAAEGNAS